MSDGAGDRRQGGRRRGPRAGRRRRARVRAPSGGRRRPASRRCWSATTRPRRSTSPTSASLTEEVGMRSIHHELGAATPEDELLELVARARTPTTTVDGILVQLPLPEQIDQDAVIAAIDPAKDVDGLTAGERRPARPGPPGARPVHAARRDGAAAPRGRRARGRRGGGRRPLDPGRPAARHACCSAANATVTVCHSRTRDLAAVCRARRRPGRRGRVAAAGRRRAGEAGRDGDRRRHEPHRRRPGRRRRLRRRSAEVAGAITPVPGGVGPMTIAMLLANTLARRPSPMRPR